MSMLDIYTDWSCIGNPGPGWWAWCLIHDTKKVQDSGGVIYTTNNQMELMACIQALEYITKNKYNAVTIHTDSTYVQLWIQSISLWSARGWKTSNRKPIKNKAMRQYLQWLTKQCIIDRKRVKAHHTSTYNNLVDSLAHTQAIQIKQSPHLADISPAYLIDQQDAASPRLL
jgi:ribonuclease HI